MKITGSCSICVRIHLLQLMNAPLEAAIAWEPPMRGGTQQRNSDSSSGRVADCGFANDVDDPLSPHSSDHAHTRSSLSCARRWTRACERSSRTA